MTGIQLQSSSKEPWVLKDAMLVGADGEVLKVTDVRWDSRNNKSINIIEAEKTKGIAKSNYKLVALTLVGQDGRVAIFPEPGASLRSDTATTRYT